MKTLLITIHILLFSFFVGTDIHASTFSGKLMNVSVISTPTPTPPPSAGSGGGGGGSSSGSSSFQLTNTADTNNDGKTDILDFVILMANWGKSGSNISADLNRDGKVDILDFVLLMSKWSK